MNTSRRKINYFQRKNMLLFPKEIYFRKTEHSQKENVLFKKTILPNTKIWLLPYLLILVALKRYQHRKKCFQ